MVIIIGLASIGAAFCFYLILKKTTCCKCDCGCNCCKDGHCLGDCCEKCTGSDCKCDCHD